MRSGLINSLLAVLLLAGKLSAFAPDEIEFFEREIRPLLVERCSKCHSAESRKLKGGLYLDSRAAVLAGGDSGPAAIAGDVEGSLLIETIRYANLDLQMPPKTRLSEGEVAALEKWIAMGLPWPDEPEPARRTVEAFDLEKRRAGHWSWHPPKQATPPAVVNESWPRDGMDRFVLAKLEKAGLEPAGDAERRDWIRRVSFDLTGLPPKPEEVDAFLTDSQPGAEERLVDRLLASPDFGVTWARHWLDLVRYAEGYGHEFDFEIPNAWRYRDYVVRAFNADLPYDQFLREQIAGDLLENPRHNPANGINESVLGTGFWWLGESIHSPTDPRADEVLRADNQIDVFAKTFLGLTVSCARCHDHKFDAISARDYYALAGVLQSSRRELLPLDPHGRRAGVATVARSLLERAKVPASESPPFARPREGAIATFETGLPSGWTLAGEGFGDGPAGNWELDLASDEPRLMPPGVVHSGRLGRMMTGVLRSPTFVLEDPEIHFHLAAMGKVEARVVIDGHFMQHFNDLLYRGTWLPADTLSTGGQWQWRSLGGDLKKYLGRRVYLEFRDDGYGYFAIDWIGSRIPSEWREAAPPVSPGEECRTVLQAVHEMEAELPEPGFALVMTEGTPEDEHVHLRGSYKSPGELVRRHNLTALGGEEFAGGSGRLELADSLAHEGHPLVSRVIVNRLWHHLMGRGIVATVDDFGVMGEAPSHPELLDWLALEFENDGWSLKRMIRRIVLSRTYRMSCQPSDSTKNLVAERDPANVLLHSYRVRRMTSESIRDQILAISGRLDNRLEGPPVPVHLTSFMEGRGRPGAGPLDGEGRRSLYESVRRNFLSPYQLVFDRPVPFTTIGRRSRSNVPAQSLALMNDPFVAAEARRWAERLVRDYGEEERISRAWREAFGREPREDERQMLEEFLAGQSGRPEVERFADLCHLLFNKKEFIYLR